MLTIWATLWSLYLVADVAPAWGLVAPSRLARRGPRGSVSRRAAAVDLSGDGGVMKVAVKSAPSGQELVDNGDVAVVSYAARVAESQQLLAQSDAALYTIGDDEWVKGWDVAMRSMKVGESASFTCAAAYGYGAGGLAPAVPAEAGLEFEIEVLDYRGNVRTASTFALDKPLTARTPESIKAQYEARMEAKRVRLEREAVEKEERDSGADVLGAFSNMFADAFDTFKSFYFFGFFESQTGEAPPWYLQPMLTFPAIFAFVALSYFALLTSGAILVRGDSPVIPGLENFSL